MLNSWTDVNCETCSTRITAAPPERQRKIGLTNKVLNKAALAGAHLFIALGSVCARVRERERQRKEQKKKDVFKR